MSKTDIIDEAIERTLSGLLLALDLTGHDRDPGSQGRLEASVTTQYQLHSRALASQLRPDDEGKVFFPVQVSGKWAPGCILVTSDRLLVARSQGVLRRSQVDEVALADIDSCSVTVDSDSPIVTVSSAGTEWSFKLGYDRNNYVTDLVCQAVNGE